VGPQAAQVVRRGACARLADRGAFPILPRPVAKARRSAKKEAPEPGEAPASVDALLERLEALVGALESGELPLEQALERFEEGMALVQRGRRMLDALEDRIEQLLDDGTREPLDLADDEPEDPAP